MHVFVRAHGIAAWWVSLMCMSERASERTTEQMNREKESERLRPQHKNSVHLGKFIRMKMIKTAENYLQFEVPFFIFHLCDAFFGGIDGAREYIHTFYRTCWIRVKTARTVFFLCSWENYLIKHRSPRTKLKEAHTHTHTHILIHTFQNAFCTLCHSV